MSEICGLCGAGAEAEYQVAPREDVVQICVACLPALAGPVPDAPHWQCLQSAIWSDVPAVQVTAWRALQGLGREAWARDLLDTAYLEPGVQTWAEALGTVEPDVIHRDANGVVLQSGDTVVLLKDLNVKGAGFTAKRGISVRGISVVAENAAQIEGRVEGQRIVILTEFVKKSG
jgi:protein PhnA